MIKVVTKCDLCGAEDKVTMRINIPSGKFCKRTWFHDFFNIGGLNYEIDVCAEKEVINNQPTADVRENITAHKVIGGGEHEGATCWFECSRCGKTVDVNDKYCSECGARFES